MIAIVAVGVALAGVIFAWKTSQKNGELSVEMEKRTREHRAFANRFSVITDVEAEAQSAQEKLATVKATHSAFVNQCQEERTGLEEQYRAASHIYEELKSETVLLEENLEDISFGLYEPHFEFDTAEDYKVELRATRDRQRKLVRSGGATNSPGTWTINGSRTEGKKMERQYTKVMLRAVLAGAVKRLDSQMLLDPLEEEFHLPARWGVRCGGFKSFVEQCQQDGAARRESNTKRRRKSDITPIHDVERSGLGKKFIQDVDVLHFACSNANKRGNIAVQIQ